jgi:hypothetical protein
LIFLPVASNSRGKRDLYHKTICNISSIQTDANHLNPALRPTSPIIPPSRSLHRMSPTEFLRGILLFHPQSPLSLSPHSISRKPSLSFPCCLTTPLRIRPLLLFTVGSLTSQYPTPLIKLYIIILVYPVPHLVRSDRINGELLTKVRQLILGPHLPIHPRMNAVHHPRGF